MKKLERLQTQIDELKQEVHSAHIKSNNALWIHENPPKYKQGEKILFDEDDKQYTGVVSSWKFKHPNAIFICLNVCRHWEYKVIVDLDIFEVDESDITKP